VGDPIEAGMLIFSKKNKLIFAVYQDFQ